MVANGADQGALIRRRVAAGTLSNYLAKFVALGSGFLLTPFLLARLGSTSYGLWVLVGSFVAYGGLLDFGMSTALIRQVAHCEATGRIDRARAYVATSVRIYVVLGLLAVVLGVLLAPMVPDLFDIPPSERDTASALVMLMGVGVGIGIASTPTTAVLRGLQRYELVSALSVAGSLLATGASVGVVLLGGGLLALVAVTTIASLLMQAVCVLIVRRTARDLRLGWRGAEWRLVSDIVGYSGAVFVMELGGRMQTRTDEILIGAFMPVSFVTPYALARRLSEIPQILTDQFMKLLVPLASQLHAADDSDRLRELYTTGTRLTLALYVPIATVLVVLARPILTAWLGQEYAEYAPLVLILTLAGLISTSQWPAGSILQGISGHRPVAVASLASGITNLGLSAALISPLGLTGVAVGTLAPTAVECLGFVLPFTLRTLGVQPGAALREIFLPPLAPVVPMVLVLWLAERDSEPKSLLSIGMCAALGLLTYALGYLVTACAPERRVCRALLASVPRLARVGTLRF
jgi:O-antigen/teichoic acid export membrane protein